MARLFLSPAFLGLLLLSFVVLLVTAFQRLFFHPLRSFPGPKLAALTGLYTAYYDIVRDGGLLEQLEKLHARYGPTMRIGPNELHFSDPRAYSTIYAPGSKMTKYPPLYDCFSLSTASFGILDPRASKIRREILSPMFSRRAILRLEDVVQEKTTKLISKILSNAALDPTTGATNLYMAFRSVTIDIITAYCFSPPQCSNALDDPTFHLPFLVSMGAFVSISWIFKHFPLIQALVMRAPAWMPAPTAKWELMRMRDRIALQIDAFLSAESGVEEGEETIYHHLLAHRGKGNSGGRSPERESLIEEGQVMIVAGSDTVGTTLTVGTVHVLADEAVRMKLVRELDGAWSDGVRQMEYQQLEKLPYLTAVIKESLRMSHGVVTPLRRVVPADTAIAGNHVPAGTVVSMSQVFVHNNPDIFPEPARFNPERWLAPNAKELDNYLVAFSKGPRSCIGINLAWCELCLIFGRLFRKLDLELHGTSVDDLRFREYFTTHFHGRQVHARVRNRNI